jgi:hypothetical protein
VFERFFFDSVCQQAHNSVPENRDKKNEVARTAYSTPAGAQTKLFYKLSPHGNVDVVLPNSCAGNHVRKFSCTEPNSAASATEMSAVRTVVRRVLSNFKFGTDMCRVTRTVLVDPERSGPFQVRPPHHSVGPC